MFVCCRVSVFRETVCREHSDDGGTEESVHISKDSTCCLSFLQIIMLVLAWHLEAANMGFFTKDEWLRGMTLLQ